MIILALIAVLLVAVVLVSGWIGSIIGHNAADRQWTELAESWGPSGLSRRPAAAPDRDRTEPIVVPATVEGYPVGHAVRPVPAPAVRAIAAVTAVTTGLRAVPIPPARPIPAAGWPRHAAAGIASSPVSYVGRHSGGPITREFARIVDFSQVVTVDV